MKELLKKKRFWIALGGVAAVVINHFLGFDETQTVEMIGAVVAAVFGASAGLAAAKE